MTITPDMAAALSKGFTSGDSTQFSQASQRAYRIFLDQWGREYGADVEKATLHPCGPFHPRFRAPIMPPKMYMVITDTVRGGLVVDTHRWLTDVMQREQDWRERVREVAPKMFGARAVNAIANFDISEMDPELLNFVGPMPFPSAEVVRAIRAGNEWVLGLSDRKPAAAAKFFPDPEEFSKGDPYLTDDPWAEDDLDLETGAGDPMQLTFPHHYGGGWYWLSEEHKAAYNDGSAPGFKGVSAAAWQASQGDWRAAVGLDTTPIDPSWEEVE
jgi:hypothetical protein